MEFYNTNLDFRQYVEKYCVEHKCTVEEALTHAMVKSAENYYKEGVSNNE
jgi:hypothetical protein